MNFESELRKLKLIPIHQLGRGSFGCVYLVYDLVHGIIAAKIFEKGKFDQNEFDASVNIIRSQGNNAFVLNYIQLRQGVSSKTILMEYANIGTLEIIVKQPHIHLPTHTLRALMKQILQGISFIHSTGQVHRDIKCDNILLHSPTGSGRVYAKISDFGFVKKEDSSLGLTYIKGTLPYMGPELFKKRIRSTQKVDIYAIGITFYKLIMNEYPIQRNSYEEYQMKLAQMKSIERPSEIEDNNLWNLLSKLLESYC
ncbi:MAG: putative Hsp70 family protein with protein kinase domain [Streblomastix strix]|uniref:Putative Hsp70 family protein with protein kinase domain n=1 Tax=Streblomastix strix TaxID=222440 RepID=A0A5J4VAI3_9EUKA|nr:MAG: putative Hsp70 family protein with protein kinase domain [Streblomastix strix]